MFIFTLTVLFILFLFYVFQSASRSRPKVDLQRVIINIGTYLDIKKVKSLSRNYVILIVYVKADLHVICFWQRFQIIEWKLSQINWQFWSEFCLVWDPNHYTTKKWSKNKWLIWVEIINVWWKWWFPKISQKRIPNNTKKGCKCLKYVWYVWMYRYTMNYQKDQK